MNVTSNAIGQINPVVVNVSCISECSSKARALDSIDAGWSPDNKLRVWARVSRITKSIFQIILSVATFRSFLILHCLSEYFSAILLSTDFASFIVQLYLHYEAHPCTLNGIHDIYVSGGGYCVLGGMFSSQIRHLLLFPSFDIVVPYSVTSTLGYVAQLGLFTQLIINLSCRSSDHLLLLLVTDPSSNTSSALDLSVYFF